MELYSQHSFQQKLQTCRTESTSVTQDNYWLDSRQKKELVRHIDPNTDEEILVEAIYTDKPPGTNIQRIILRLCTDDGKYDLRLL